MRLIPVALVTALSVFALDAHAQSKTASRPTEKSKTIVETAVAAGSFQTLAKALTAAGLVEALSGQGPFTVFAPTDDAFAKLPTETIASLLEPKNVEQLRSILKYHVVAGEVPASAAAAAKQAATLNTESVRIAIVDGQLKINDSKVVKNDIGCSNGVIHVIDTVLLPPSLTAPQGRKVIGLYVEGIDEALATQLSLNPHQALLVTDLVDGGNAQDAGLRKFDVVVHVDGKPATEDELNAAKERAGVGGTIRLDFLRNGKKRQVDVEVGVVSE